jgi:hypothetical protein
MAEQGIGERDEREYTRLGKSWYISCRNKVQERPFRGQPGIRGLAWRRKEFLRILLHSG